MGRHIEEKFRLRIVLAENGERTVISGAGLGGDPLGNLFLHHDCHRLEALGFQQGRQNGRGDVVGQVGAGHGPQSAEFLLHQRRHIQLQHIVPDDLQVFKFTHRDVQNGL